MKLLTVLMLAALSSTASSQERPVVPDKADAGANAAAKTINPSPTDVSFVKQLAMGGVAEVAAGNLASNRGQDKQVKDFGKQMVTDHSKANEKLASLARGKNLEVPTKPDADHMAKQAALEKMSGNAFDKKYVDGQVEDHQKTVQLLQHEINSGQDKDLKQFATETLPVVSHHLEMIKQLQTKMGSATP